MNADTIRPVAQTRAGDIIRHLLPHGHEHAGEWVIGGTHGQPGKSMRCRMEGERAGMWIDRESGEGGDIFHLWQAINGVTHSAAVKEMAHFLGIEDETDPAKAKHWKQLQAEMGHGTEHDLQDLAILRDLPTTEGLALAVEREHLFFASVYDDKTTHHCWLITDSARKSAQARRMDGEPFGDGQKSKTIHGTIGSHPIGIADAPAGKPIALVEGGPDFLAAYTAVALLKADVYPVSMLGSGQTIEPATRHLFANRTIFVFPHEDHNYAGLKGAIRWEQQLKSVSARFIPFDFRPYGVKDLNEFVALTAKKETV